MRKGEIRDSQLATIVAEELEYILSSAEDPRLAELTITAVHPKKGGGHFIVYVAPEEGAVQQESVESMKDLLKRATPFLRAELATAVNFKRAPEITLMPDPFYVGRALLS